MKGLRIFIVEDETAILNKLDGLYRQIFGAHGYEANIERAVTAEQARQLAKTAKDRPFDLVSLDVNLADQTLTGLDVLDSLKRFQSAWMVALLTGVETDASLDKTIGKERADSLRKQLRRDAYARFPGERLVVIEKPSSKLAPHEAERLLRNRLEQIALLYEEIGRLRYIFRPIEVTGLERIAGPKGSKTRRRFIETTAVHWQIRFNCGEIRTLPDMAGFQTLHYLLSRNPDEQVTPEEALVYEPKTEKSKVDSTGAYSNSLADYFEPMGITWNSLSPEEQDKLLKVAIAPKFHKYVELRGYQDDDDLTPAEEDELNRIIKDIGALAEVAETGYQRLKPKEEHGIEAAAMTAAEMSQNDLHIDGGNYDRLGIGRRGMDSPAAQLFRARMKRVRDCLRENGFADFARHLETYLQSTGANWSYNPPDDIEWTT